MHKATLNFFFFFLCVLFYTFSVVASSDAAENSFGIIDDDSVLPPESKTDEDDIAHNNSTDFTEATQPLNLKLKKSHTCCNNAYRNAASHNTSFSYFSPFNNPMLGFKILKEDESFFSNFGNKDPFNLFEDSQIFLNILKTLSKAVEFPEMSFDNEEVENNKTNGSSCCSFRPSSCKCELDKPNTIISKLFRKAFPSSTFTIIGIHPMSDAEAKNNTEINITKSKTEGEVDEAKNKVEDKVDETKSIAEDKVDETKSIAEDKVDETKNKTEGEVDKTKSEVGDKVDETKNDVEQVEILNDVDQVEILNDVDQVEILNDVKKYLRK